MRVLGRLRLSRSTEESTSIERQREIISGWVESSGHTLVGWAEDIDVSGSVDPFDTPGLGKWLNDRTSEWDALAVWKLDRLTRSTINLNRVFAWCLKHDKTVVSVTESIDLGTPVGRLIANVIGFLAEGELEAIRERVRGSKRKLRELGRWGGGKPPYGYTAVRSGTGWSLEVDPLASTVVRRIVADVIDGRPMARTVRELNDEGYLTPADYYDTVKAGKPKLRAEAGVGSQWSTTPIRNMLRSKAIRGYAHHKGETVRDDEGMPVQLAEPLVTLDEWELVQTALDTVQRSRVGVQRAEDSPLAGVVMCIKCELPLHHDKTISRGHVYRYYRCRNRDTAMIPADRLEEVAADEFLEKVGDRQVQARVWAPGDAREADLREALSALDELSSAAGRAKSASGKQRLQAQLDALDEKIAELESAPAREAHWEFRPTGEGTYRSVWETADADRRRELLLRSGIRLWAGIDGVVGKRSASNAGVNLLRIYVPEELESNLGLSP